MASRSSEFQRLGKRELGPHAFEKRMPSKLASLLESKDLVTNTQTGVIHKLALLYEQNNDLEVVYLCREDVEQVYKLDGEGGHFCAYRNMQMLLSAYMPAPLARHDDNGTQPFTIPRLQQAIEAAWDAGCNAHGRAQTGGVLNTRKHVGTSEAEALLLSLNIAYASRAFAGKEAWRKLLGFCERHFAGYDDPRPKGVVKHTSCSPIFLQRPGHSITIVGVERTESSGRRLITFDPAWKPPAVMTKDADFARFGRWRCRYILGHYRKGDKYLRRYKEFETLVITRVINNKDNVCKRSCCTA